MADFFRFWWALVALNGRKTMFRARGCRGRCPCQSPSDSGRAWVTHCEEAALWDKPERFARVCPSFQRGPQGWRCGVDTAEVRPFWMRALWWYGGSFAVLWTAGALMACGYFVHAGYTNVTPLDTVAPWRWSRVTRARSGLFLQQAKVALTRMDERAMRVSLASAAAAAADDYEAQLAIAQIYSHLADHHVASQSFQRLLADFPTQRHRTAVAYHDALLAARQLGELGEFALNYLAREPGDDATVWLRAAFGALRGTRWPEQLLERNAAALAKLPPLWREALRAEAQARATGSLREFVAAAVPVKPENAALLILIGETIAECAPPNEALDEIARLAPAIGTFERDRLLFRLHVRRASARSALQAFDAMLRSASKPAQRERLLAALVEFPDAERVERLVSAASNPQTPFTPSELAGLWIAAAASGHDRLRSLAGQRLRAHYALAVDPLMPATFGPANAAIWIRVLPVARETVWALARKFGSPVPERRRIAG